MSASSKKKLRKEQQALQMTEKQQQAQKEAKKLKISTIAFVLVMAIVLSVFAGTVLYKALDIPGIIARHDTVLEVNDHDISAIELSYFYVDAISSQYNSWYNQYGDYTAMMISYLYGLNPYSPLNKSYYDTENKVTWADMFANQAIKDATEIYTLYDAAKAAGHEMTKEELATVDTMISNIESYAVQAGYKNLTAYLVDMYGKGANKDTYREYLVASSLAGSYRSSYADSLSYTDADHKAYLDEHPNDFSSFSYTTYLLRADAFYEGGTKEEGSDVIIYSDEEKAAGLDACKKAADSILAAKPKTAKELNDAIANLSIYKKDDAKADSSEADKDEEDDKTPTATSNTDVSYGQVSETYREWISDSSRKAGDFTVLPVTSTTKAEDGTETTVTTGYYAVLFDSRNDYDVETVNVRHILIGFEGGTTKDGVTTYTEAEKLAAKEKAEEVMEKFNATNKTEDDFIALVKDNSDDDGSVNNGGLYQRILPGEMVEGFDEWIFDESRKNGDCEIVETKFGYHLIFFLDKDELLYRDYMIDNTLRNDAVTAWVKGLIDNTKIGEKDISKLELDYVIAPSY